MAKFAIVVPPLTGHINPTLSLGSELLRRGHEVGWISLDSALQDKLPEGGQLLLIRYERSDEAKQESEAYLDIISRKACMVSIALSSCMKKYWCRSTVICMTVSGSGCYSLHRMW